MRGERLLREQALSFRSLELFESIYSYFMLLFHMCNVVGLDSSVLSVCVTVLAPQCYPPKQFLD